MKQGWGAVLRGAETDLDDWRYALATPFDPWTEVYGEDTILRSSRLDSLNSADEVRAHALDMIAYLNGALALWQYSKPVAFGGTVEFTSDGKLHRTMFAETGVFEIRSKVRAVGMVLVDGKPVKLPPQKTPVQEWADIAESEPLLHEALMYVGREGPTWFNIYRALECLEMRFGGGETQFLKLEWASPSHIKLMKRSANTLRHAKQKFEPPEKPMTIGEATALLGALLRRGLAEALSNPGR